MCDRDAGVGGEAKANRVISRDPHAARMEMLAEAFQAFTDVRWGTLGQVVKGAG